MGKFSLKRFELIIKRHEVLDFEQKIAAKPRCSSHQLAAAESKIMLIIEILTNVTEKLQGVTLK